MSKKLTKEMFINRSSIIHNNIRGPMKVYVDEVGTGAIFGFLLVAAVIDTGHRPIEKLKDSKAYSQNKREFLYKKLAPELTYAFGAANVQTIKKMNVHYAKYQSMKNAIESLIRRGNCITEVIVDGSFKIPNLNIFQTPIIKADEKFWACSAASILAKVTRDNIITKISRLPKYKHYGLASNKGYYSQAHLNGIIKYGLTDLHRENHKYVKYSSFEHQEFVKSEVGVDKYIEWVQSHKKITGESRYNEWLKTTYKENKKTWGEQEW